jgi:hypothetical protein
MELYEFQFVIGSKRDVDFASGAYERLGGRTATCPVVRHFSCEYLSDKAILPVSFARASDSWEIAKIFQTARTGNR